MKIQRIIIQCDASASHPCIKLEGARRRDYYFQKEHDTPFRRIYQGDTTDENKGIYPLAQMQADLNDILAGEAIRTWKFSLHFLTADEADATDKEVADARKRKADFDAAMEAERLALEAQQSEAEKQGDAPADEAPAEKPAEKTPVPAAPPKRKPKGLPTE